MGDRKLPRVLTEADSRDPEPGDFFLEIHGTFRIDPDGSWRGFDRLSPDELLLIDALIRIDHLESAIRKAVAFKTDPKALEAWNALGSMVAKSEGEA